MFLFQTKYYGEVILNCFYIIHGFGVFYLQFSGIFFYKKENAKKMFYHAFETNHFYQNEMIKPAIQSKFGSLFLQVNAVKHI